MTINLDEEMYRMAKALAIAEDCSISAAVNKLLRRINEARNGSNPEGREHSRQMSSIGLPVVACKKAITADDVYRTEEAEAFRHWTS